MRRLAKTSRLAVTSGVAVLLAVSLCRPARAQEEQTPRGGKYSVAGLDDEREVERFFLAFKEAVAADDKARVASMVSFPVSASLASGRRVRIRNRAEFVRRYDSIFDRAFKRLIAETRVEDLWAKWSGVATPRGEIWINGVGRNRRNPDEYEIKITAINGRLRG